MRRVTRREFLLRATGLAASVEVGRRMVAPAEARAGGLAEGLGEACAEGERWPAAVVAQGTNDDTADALLKTALAGAGGMERFVRPGQTVCIKPNCTWDYPPFTASSTDPDLLAAVIRQVQAAGAKRVIVLDHPTLSSAAACLDISGIGKVLETLKVEKVFPDRTLAPADTYTVIDVPKGKVYQKLTVIKAAVEADVRINMAVAKSHVVLPVTLCLKHMMGFLENPPALHANLEQGLVDLNGAPPVAVSLHILEAIRVRLKGMAAGHETDITNPRLVKRFNQVVVGTDPVLIDSYACINYFGRQPKEVRYVKLAGEQGLGEMDVKKATDEGRLRVFKVGEALSTPMATATATGTPTQTPVATAPATATPAGTPTPTLTPSPTQPPPTWTPLPTATPEPAGLLPTPVIGAGAASSAAAGGAAAGGVTCAPGVVSPNQFLSGALLPVAAVITGAGVVVGRRLERRDGVEADPEPHDEQGDAASQGS